MSLDPTEMEPLPPATPALAGPRYVWLARLSQTPSAEVWRVRDDHVGREVVLKTVARGASSALSERLQGERAVLASLDHPGIVTLLDAGELEDGRPYFTLREIRGRTMREALDSRQATRNALWLGRMVEVLRRAADALAHAHAKGVVHRDLKPTNLMMGAFGEVYVIDWGIAAQEGRVFDAGSGTPRYMAPEQALGRAEQIGPATDVYALGAMLYEILGARPPLAHLEPLEVRAALRRGEGPDLSDLHGPSELVSLCAAALAFRPEDRPEDASVFAAELGSWREGARKAQRAEALVISADLEGERVIERRVEAEERRREAASLLRAVPGHAPAAQKEPAWALEDAADELDRAALVAEARRVELLEAALLESPEHPGALERLADLYRARLAQAEATGDRHAIVQEMQLRRHDRGRYAGWLRGEGALTLWTDPPGAELRLFRYEERGRRLVPERVSYEGVTPVTGLPLPMGSYLVTLHAPGRMSVRYPVAITRGAAWDGVRPGDTAPTPIYLPEAAPFSDAVYIPAGFTTLGGDPQTSQPLPPRRVWLDGYWIGRHPVTNARYLQWLNQLVEGGREDEALLHAPQLRGAPIYGRDAAGRFTLVPDPGGDLWLPDYPVLLVDWRSASCFVRAQGARLPADAEWEKAARGADGRSFPWGRTVDPAFCALLDSHEGRPSPVEIARFPTDESPYGVRGLAGNTRDWCRTAYSVDRPERVEGAVLLAEEVAADAPGLRDIRGGSWLSPGRMARSALHGGLSPTARSETTGIRPVVLLSDLRGGETKE